MKEREREIERERERLNHLMMNYGLDFCVLESRKQSLDLGISNSFRHFEQK